MDVCANWSPALALRAGSTVSKVLRCTTLVSLSLILPLLFSSCFVTDFIGAYFNTYYNAQRAFDEAEADVFSQLDSRPTGRTYLLPCAISPATKTKLTSVIEKCSKLLQYHPESNLVDDALMMIGKAYYYSDEDQKAERKFRELIDGFPESNRELEAKLLLSYSLYRMNNKGEARATALKVIEEAENEGEPAILARACSVLGMMELEEKNYDAARKFYQQAAENGESGDQRSASYLIVAEMWIHLEEYSQAEKAYKKALNASTSYAGEYRSRMGVCRMLSMQGEFEDALQELHDLRANTNNKEFFGEIDLETGNVYRDMGEIKNAIAQYTVVDTMYARTETAAKSYYALGNLYENTLFQYDSAQVAYNKARGEFPQALITANAIQRGDYLNRYFQYRREISKYDSIRAIVLAPDTIRAIKSGSDSSAVASRGGTDSTRGAAHPKPLIPLDSIDVRLATAKNELGGLFYATIGLPDSAEYWYRRLVDEHPKSSFLPRALYSLARLYSRDTLASQDRADSLYRLIIREYPKSEYATEARRVLGLPAVTTSTDPAAELYTRGEQLMLEGNYVTAVDTFKIVPERYPASPYSPQALYAAGWIFENQLQLPDSAIAIYQRLMILYPTSTFALRVQPKLAEVQVQRAALAASAKAADSSKVALGPPPPSSVPGSAKGADSSKVAPGPPPPSPANEQPKTIPPSPPPPGTSPAEAPNNPPGKEGVVR